MLTFYRKCTRALSVWIFALTCEFFFCGREGPRRASSLANPRASSDDAAQATQLQALLNPASGFGDGKLQFALEYQTFEKNVQRRVAEEEARESVGLEAYGSMLQVYLTIN